MSSAAHPAAEDLRGYIDYLRDLGVYDLFQWGGPSDDASLLTWYGALAPKPSAAGAQGTSQASARPAVAESALPAAAKPAAQGTKPAAQGAASTSRPATSPFEQAQQRSQPAARPASAPGLARSFPEIVVTPSIAPPQAVASQRPANDVPSTAGIFTPDMPKPTPFNLLTPLPKERATPDQKPAALAAVRDEIGDCTRCPLAYAGRHTIVFADGSPHAKLMFVGEGPGADEDASGLPFIGKAGQLLNNMIAAMGLARDAVYISNIVKCRPPQNRTPEPVEANTCSPFLLKQIDIVQPEVIVALGSTAATYLLGVKQSLATLRGQWFDVRGSKCAVTYHPAFLLRDPRQKGEAWKDRQRVMVELKLKPHARSVA